MNSGAEEIEPRAFRALPAEEVAELGGWRLRFTHRVTRRGNSVWPNLLIGDLSLEARVEAAEAFYRERGAPPYFQISEAAEPRELDAYLAERGYVIDAPVSIETLALDRFHFPGQPPQLTTRVGSTPDEEWLTVAGEHGRFAGNREIYLGILNRIATPLGFAVARRANRAIAAGLGVVDGPWLGIFNMATLPDERRQYAATAVLGALVGWASAHGAGSAYLQVEESNHPARALYRALGFVHAYSYHYRTRS